MNISAGAWLPVLRWLPDSAGDVALSYDDGPNADSTPRLLDVLDAHRARASFFLSGFRAVDHPDIVGEIVRRGHQIYAHGWDHIKFAHVETSIMIDAMERTEALLRQHRPTPSPYLVRLPRHNGYRSSRIHRALRHWRPDAQYAHTGIAWQDHEILRRCGSAEDVEPECRTAVDELFATEQVSGAILILHDQPCGIDSPYGAEVAVRLTDILLTKLGQRGLRAVPIAPMPTPQPLRSRFLFA